MSAMLGSCGIDCALCPAHIATSRNDDALRAKTAAEWSKMFGSEIKPENINCKGCRTDTGVQIAHCAVCEIRICAEGRKVENCAPCPDYPCGKLDFIFKADAGAKDRLDAIKAKCKPARKCGKGRKKDR